jgi:hypothetical protein
MDDGPNRSALLNSDGHVALSDFLTVLNLTLLKKLSSVLITQLMTTHQKAERRTAVRDLKRGLILDAARKVFEAEGLDGASLRSIASAAEYRRGRTLQIDASNSSDQRRTFFRLSGLTTLIGAPFA